MKKGVYIFELLIFIFIIAYRFVILKYTESIADIVLVIVWLLFFLGFYKFFGIRKDNSLIKKPTTQIIIIGILLFVLIGYSSGIIFGFLKNSHALNIISIIKNIYPLIFMIIFQELIRFIVAKRNQPISLVILTILFVLMDFVLTYNASNITSSAKLFVYITNTILPSLARNILCSYLALKVSFIPGLILRLFFNLHIYILPIFPDYGYYISSMVGILLPYALYLAVAKLIESSEKEKVPVINRLTWYINIPLLLIIVFMLMLTTGLFKYQMIVIGSGSMEPYVYVGDTVIFEHLEEKDIINENDIIVFIKDNVRVVHRVIKIETINNKRYYQTKGDNNNTNDDYILTDKDIIGKVKLRIKGIGMPSIWFQELIS